MIVPKTDTDSEVWTFNAWDKHDALEHTSGQVGGTLLVKLDQKKAKWLLREIANVVDR